jgi:hypothetical protein
MAFISLVSPIYYNVKNYGALGDGVTDDTTAIQSAITAAVASVGGIVYFPPATYQVSTPLSISQKNTVLLGAGPGSVIRPTSGFVGAQVIGITADYCGVHDLMIAYANTTSSGNPAANGIEVTGARYASLFNLQLYYINGWAIESLGTAGVNNVGGVMHSVHITHCAQGIHIKGVTGSNFVGQNQVTDILVETVDNGDCILLEDINDCQVTNFGGAAAGGATTGCAIHVKGGSSNTFTNIDVGMIAQGTASPTILVETATADPNNLTFIGGVAQNGKYAVQITAANNVKFTGLLFKHSNLDGINISASNGPITFRDCTIITNNQSNGTAYEINSSQSGGNFYVDQCLFQTAIGTGVGLVTNAVNDSTHRGYFYSCHFIGTGTTVTNVFNGTPQIVRTSVGYNPRGSITPATIGASPFTGNTSQNDILLIFTAIAGMTAFAIGGTSVGLPTVNTPYRIPARQAFTVTWATTAPTYIWIAE